MDDLISRQQAIDALENDKAELDKIIKGMSAMDVRLDAYVSQRNQVVYDIYAIEQLPPIQPVNCSEFPNNSDVVDRQKAKNAICNACGKIDCDEMDTCEKLDIPSEGSKLLQPWEVLVAQAVLPQPEIVRCKDCKHRYVEGDNVRYNTCELNHNNVQSDDWYCADAKRRKVTI